MNGDGELMKVHVQKLARSFDTLPRECYGQIVLHVEAGRVHRVEVNQSIRTPPQRLDKARG